MEYLKTKKYLKNKKFKWLITGVAGFIGSNLLEELLLLNQKVIGVDNFSTGKKENLIDVKQSVNQKWKNFKLIKGDLSDLKVAKKAIKNVDFVLHQAARGSIPKSTIDPIETNKDNVTSFLNILKLSKEKNIKSFVYASSSSVYGDDKNLPKKENKVGKVLSNYALTKKINENYSRLFFDLYGYKTVGLRYFNVFGKRQNPSGDYAAVIPKWINLIKKNKKIIIFGDGKTSRDFCHIDNVIQANILSALQQLKKNNYIFNVGTKSTISLQNLSQAIYKYTFLNKKIKKKIEYKNFRKGDIRHSQADVYLIKKILKYKPLTYFDEGLIKTINWFSKIK